VLEPGQAGRQFETGKRWRLIGTGHRGGAAAATCVAPTAAGVVRMMTATGVMPAASAASTT
jgi:hypothetical protein